MSKRLYSTTVEVDVDVYAEDIDDDTLVEICEERGILASTSVDDDITEMFYAFRLGRDSHAIELARKIAQDRTGRIL